MKILESEPVYALCPTVLTVLGSGSSFWNNLCLGKSGLRPACEAFPGWFPNDKRAVGALFMEEDAPRMSTLLDRLLELIDPKHLALVDGIFAATSLGDLLGPDAGYPQNVFTLDKPLSIVSSACSSGSDALSLGYLSIKAGQADALFILAVDSLCPAKLAHHIALGTQSPTQARPFDILRNGTSFGEGGAALILANARGVERMRESPLVEITGVGFSCDGYDITMPDPSGRWASLAIQMAQPKTGYINAHGTGTHLNDLAEAKALCSQLDIKNCFVSSTKGALGHTLGVTGLLESIVCIEALRTGKIPRTTGLKEIDPELGFSPLIEGPALERSFNHALSVTFGFGGVNSAISMTKV